MKNRFFRMLALFTCMVMAILALCAVAASGEENIAGFLGKPFPDFTATDTEGNTFTLSEALKDHEAVLINFWATWCNPCRNEFPYLNEAYEKYRDRVAFIALSTDHKRDTIEKIAEYRRENGISFPMGRDDDKDLYSYIGSSSLPNTVIVDRFGNAVYFHENVISSTNIAERILDTFLGDGYTETAVLNEIPRDTSTRSFPVSATRAIYPESGNCRKILLHAESVPGPITGYLVPEPSVRLRIEIAPEDDVINMTYLDSYQAGFVNVLSMLDPKSGHYVYDQRVFDSSDETAYTKIGLFDGAVEDDEEKTILMFLFRDEEGISKLAEEMKGNGEGDLIWEYADTDEKAEDASEAYIIHVLDQDGNPVEEVSVNFCTDQACVPRESDETGTITFTGPQDVYHVQIVEVPEGYSWDESYEMYTPDKYGEWVLRVRKD